MPRIKKEDEFYTMLKEFAALITESADEYNKIICSFPDSMSSIPQMKVYESTADERVKAIMAKLYTSFITPIDREDISNLALAMDDVVDSMYGVAVRLDLFNMSDLRIEAKQISELTVQAPWRTRATPSTRRRCAASSPTRRTRAASTRSPGCASSTAWSSASTRATASPASCATSS